MTNNADFIAGYHTGYKAALAHLNDVPGLVLPGNVAAILGDDTRRNGLAESAAAEQHAAPLIDPDAIRQLRGDYEALLSGKRPPFGELERDDDGNPTELGAFIGQSAPEAEGAEHEQDAADNVPN